jgi:hypothetical protein
MYPYDYDILLTLARERYSLKRPDEKEQMILLTTELRKKYMNVRRTVKTVLTPDKTIIYNGDSEKEMRWRD